MPRTLFDKIWDSHEVADNLLYIDLHLVHEVTSPQAFDGLRLAGRKVRRPDRTLATADHNVPTDGTPVAARIKDALSRTQVETLERNCAEFGIPVYSLGSDRQGIVHVIGPELGVTQPGMTIVRAGERRRGGSPERGHAFEVLTAPLPGQRAELSRHVLAAGAATGGEGDPPMHEPGSREIALVERGTVVLHIDGLQYELAEGDTVTFDADLAHRFENPGPGDAVLLAVVSAGLRRS